ncbi:hypothetical protein HOD08_00255, partial [bacterium]|nr:hypothetical protein [bacterium]
MNITTESGVKKRPLESGRNYGEVISLLASKSQIEYSEEVLKRTKALDALFDHVSRKTDVILIGGSNGKSSSANLTAKLLKKEGFKVGVAYSSHFLTYNERLAVDGQQINNRDFTDVVDKVLTEAELNKINATAFEIMTIASLLYASQEKAEVIVLEVGIGGRYDATAICNPKIMALTRVADGHSDVLGDDLDEVAGEIMAAAKPGTWFISSDQSKP